MRHDFNFEVEGHTAAEIERKALEIADRFFADREDLEGYRIFINSEVLFYSYVPAGTPMCKASVSVTAEGI